MGYDFTDRNQGASEMKRTEPVIHSDREIIGATPVFVGTRVAITTPLHYVEAREPLSEFLDDFPTVSREQAVAAFGRRSSAARVTVDEFFGEDDESVPSGRHSDDSPPTESLPVEFRQAREIERRISEESARFFNRLEDLCLEYF